MRAHEQRNIQRALKRALRALRAAGKFLASADTPIAEQRELILNLRRIVAAAAAHAARPHDPKHWKEDTACPSTTPEPPKAPPGTATAAADQPSTPSARGVSAAASNADRRQDS